MEALIIIFVIFSIVSSIAKKRAEERKRQEKQTKTRLQNAYPPSEWHRSSPQMPYEQPGVSRQADYEPQPAQYEPAQSPWPPQDQYAAAPQDEAVPSQPLYEKLFDAVHPGGSLQEAPSHRIESAPTVSDKLRRKVAPTVADKLKRETSASAGFSEPAMPAARRVGGFVLAQSRSDIVNGVIWSEILARPGERNRRRAF